MKFGFLILLFCGVNAFGQTQQSLTITSNTTNVNPRPPLTAGTMAGEIRGSSFTGFLADDGFLRHLEGIPSAETIEKENLDLGNIQVQLLKKMEEMTLYMIELKKENDHLKMEIEALKKK